MKFTFACLVRLGIGCLALGATLGGTRQREAWGAAGDAPVAVLGIEASTDDNTPEAVATALTDALRQRVSATKGLRLIPGRDLAEVKLVFSCAEETPSCMAQAAKSLGASKLIFGTVKRQGTDAYLVTLKLLDATKATVEALISEQITRLQASAPAIRGPVQKWFVTLTGQGGVGIIKVKSDAIGASVQLDGIPSGVTSADDLIIPGVTAGRHDIVVTKLGYPEVQRPVTVIAGETILVEAPLSGNSSPPPPTASNASRPEEPTPTGTARDSGPQAGNTGMRPWAWGTLGAGLVGVGMGIYSSAQIASINSDLDKYRRVPCAASANGCNLQGEPYAKPRTAADKTYTDGVTSDGKRFQTYQWASYGLGVALLATSGYLFYKGYFEKEEASGVATGPRLRLFPLAYGTGGGLERV